MFSFGIAGGGHGPVRVAEPLQLDGDGRGLFGSLGSGGGRGDGPPLGSRLLGGGPAASPRLSLLAHQHQSVPNEQTMDQNYWSSINQPNVPNLSVLFFIRINSQDPKSI
jgi:hypothetical protein